MYVPLQMLHTPALHIMADRYKRSDTDMEMNSAQVSTNIRTKLHSTRTARFNGQHITPNSHVDMEGPEFHPTLPHTHTNASHAVTSP
jgi:hypothetical protein